MKEKSALETKEHIESVSELYTLPSVLFEILALCQDPDSASRDISRCVERDQAIAMKVLRVANSAYTGLHQRVSSIPLAVHLLGPREVVELATSVAVFQFVSGKYSDSRLDLKLLWNHSILTAVASGLISDRLDRPSTGIEFTAGLLHDIGKVVMAQEFPDEMSAALDMADSRQIPLIDAETKVFGVSHARTGSWLAELWGLPQRLTEAIRFHHTPTDVLSAVPPTTDPSLSAIIYLADAASQIGSADQTYISTPDNETIDTARQLLVLENSSVDTERLADIIEEINASADRVEKLTSAFGAD